MEGVFLKEKKKGGGEVEGGVLSVSELETNACPSMLPSHGTAMRTLSLLVCLLPLSCEHIGIFFPQQESS